MKTRFSKKVLPIKNINPFIRYSKHYEDINDDVVYSSSKNNWLTLHFRRHSREGVQLSQKYAHRQRTSKSEIYSCKSSKQELRWKVCLFDLRIYRVDYEKFLVNFTYKCLSKRNKRMKLISRVRLLIIAIFANSYLNKMQKQLTKIIVST